MIIFTITAAAVRNCIFDYCNFWQNIDLWSQYCTISTVCSRGVTRDDLWTSDARFTGPCDVWQTIQVFTHMFTPEVLGAGFWISSLLDTWTPTVSHQVSCLSWPGYRKLSYNCQYSIKDWNWKRARLQPLLLPWFWAVGTSTRYNTLAWEHHWLI
jgi:hypothetical protein